MFSDFEIMITEILSSIIINSNNFDYSAIMWELA